MAIDEQLPPACAFAVSVLKERDFDPDLVPEEAVEAAQHHMATCPQCLNAAASSTPRKKKKTRRVAERDKLSCPIALRLSDNVLLTSTQAQPVILGMQQDGSVQIVG